MQYKNNTLFCILLLCICLFCMPPEHQVTAVSSRCLLKARASLSSQFNGSGSLAAYRFSNSPLDSEKAQDRSLDGEKIHMRGLENEIGMIFVPVHSGSFEMGSPEHEQGRDPDEIMHQVILTGDFYIQAYEVTNSQYAVFLNKSGLLSEAGKQWFQTRDQDKDSCIVFKDGRYLPAAGFEQYPVTEVSWYGARAFAEWLSKKTGDRYSLPTEAQWEYSCRASTLSRFFWGRKAGCSRMMHENSTRDRGSHKNDRCVMYNSRKGLKLDSPAPAGSYPPNPWKIHDMHGNVWEWCKDRYGEYSRISEYNPDGPVSGDLRVIRGSSWQDTADTCRSANRHSAFPMTCHGCIGFRLVLYP